MYAYHITVHNINTGMDNTHYGFICANGMGEAEDVLNDKYNEQFIISISFRRIENGDVIEQKELERISEWFQRMEQA